jgi:phenylacetic acid degradation operon negative regulatory protein
MCWRAGLRDHYPLCGRLPVVHARSALFDLYGDHLRSRGGQAPVAGLVRLLEPLAVTPAAVRTAISRMVRQGWLAPVRTAAGPGYRLTERARQRLDDAAARIYRTRQPSWDGSWDLLVLEPLPHRSARARVREGLAFLGSAAISDSTWISPGASPEVDELLAAEAAGFARFAAREDDPVARAAQAWDLDGLAASYTGWLQLAKELVAEPVQQDEAAFAVRSRLVHEWRKFLFTDPGLPAELLPPDWPGETAARFFDEEAARLLPAASRFIDACLTDPYDVPDQTGAHP